MPRPKKSKNQAKETPRRKSPTEIVPLVHADNLSDREPDTPPQEPRHRTASPVGHSPTISTPDENLQARLGRLEKVFDEVSELKKHILEFTAVIPPAAGTCEHSSRQHGHDNAHEQPRVDRHPSPHHAGRNEWSGTSHGMDYIPNPRQIREDPAARAYISHHADDALPKFTATMGQGNYSAYDCRMRRQIPRPFMYVERDNIQSSRDRAAIRASMSYPEYLNAYLAMLRDHNAVDDRDRPFVLDHLFQVSQDVLSRPWHAVRRWSDTIFDKIDRCEIEWCDREAIHYDRIRISVSATGTTDPEPCVEVMCPHYNNGSCAVKGDQHNEGTVRFVHMCAYCNSLTGSRFNHPAAHCNKRARAQNQYKSNYQNGQGNSNNYNAHTNSHGQRGLNTNPTYFNAKN